MSKCVCTCLLCVMYSHPVAAWWITHAEKCPERDSGIGDDDE